MPNTVYRLSVTLYNMQQTDVWRDCTVTSVHALCEHAQTTAIYSVSPFYTTHCRRNLNMSGIRRTVTSVDALREHAPKQVSIVSNPSTLLLLLLMIIAFNIIIITIVATRTLRLILV